MSLFDTFSKSSESGGTPTGGTSLYDSFTESKGLTTRRQKRRYTRKTRKEFEAYSTVPSSVKDALEKLPKPDEIKEPEPTFMKKLGEGILAGGKDLAETVGTGVNEYNRFFYKTFNKGKGAFGEAFDPVYQKDKQKLEEFSKKTEERLVKKLGQEGADSFTVQASRALGQGIGQLGVFALNPVVGTATISAQVIGAGKQAYDTAYEQSIAQGKTEEEAKKIATINGIVTGVVNMAEAIPLARTVGIAQKALTQPLKTGAKAIISRVAKTGAIEAGTEGLQQAGEDITAKLTYDGDRTVLKNAIMATLVSIPTGILFGGAGEINVTVRNRELAKAQSKIAKAFEEGGTPTDQAAKVAGAIVSQYAVLGDENAFDIPKPESTKQEVKPVEEKTPIAELPPEKIKTEIESIATKIKTQTPIRTTFKPAEMNENFDENPVAFKEGDIVIDRNGNAQEVVSGNAKWVEDKENPLRDNNIGIVRTKDIGDEKDFIGYANQLRHASESEISQIQKDTARIAKREAQKTPEQIAQKMASKPRFASFAEIADELVIKHGVPQKEANEIARKAVTVKVEGKSNKDIKEKPKTAKKAPQEKAPVKQEEVSRTVVPDFIEEISQEKFSKPFAELKKAEVKKIVFRGMKDFIIKTDDDAVISKLSTSQYDKDVFARKPELVFKGLEEGVFTDSYVLISKSDVAKKLLNEYIDKNKPAEPSEEMTFPDWKQIVPKEKGEKAEVKGYIGGQVPSIVLETKSGKQVFVMPEKWAFMKKYLPDADIFIIGERSPVTFREKGKTVGLLMPIYRDESSRVSFEGEKPKFVNRSGGQASPLDLSKTTQNLVNKLTKKTPAPEEIQEVPKDFKLSEEAKKILQEMGIPYVAEKSLARGLAGVYKPLAKKVRVQSLYDLSTVVHEGTHGLDDKIGFTKKLISDTTRGAKVRKQLTEIYVDLYPSAKATHKLRTRLSEGLAVLFENYFYDPASVKEKYPDLVKDFIEPKGKYHREEFTTLLEKMNGLVQDYAKLTPEQRIGARIRTGKEVVAENKGFTPKQRLIFETVNKFEPLNRYAKTAGVKETWEDPTVQAFTILRKNSIVSNWIYGERKPILKKNGDWEFRKGTVEDYMKVLKTQDNIQNFRSYLIARRVLSMHNELARLQNTYDMAVETGGLDDVTSELKTEIERLAKIIKNDDFSLQDATAVVGKYATEFAEAEKIYDSVNSDMIDFMYESDLIDKETAQKYKSQDGYASFQRYIDENLDSTLGTMQNSTKSKVSSLRGRTGSTLDIIDPLYSQIMAVNETIAKGLENRLWERVDNIAQKNPELASRFEKLPPVTAVDMNGKVSFPQEKDPSIIRFFKDGKREFRKAPPEMIAVMKTMRGKEFDGFAQLLRIPSSIFSRLTTTANPFFFVTNFTVDQFSALTNTKTGYKPLVDPAKGLVDYFKHQFGKDGTDGNKIAEYLFLGGERQTLAAYQDLSPEDLTKKLSGEESKLAKAGKVIDAGLGVLETPSNFSEIMTRFGEYKRSVEMGEPMSVAMYRASEISTPFELRGNVFGHTGQAIIQAIPYFNAALQVLYKFGRTSQANPKRVATIGASLLAVSLSSTIAMMAFSTDEQKRLLAQQPARLMAKNMFFPSPNGKDLIRIRVPEQFGSLIAMVQLYVISQYDANKATFNEYIEAGTSFLPQQLNILQPEQMVLSWLPQLIKPTIETALNKKTYPSILPIVPDYLIDKPKSEQYTDYTSGVAKFLGKLTDSSPMLIDFWVREQFGVVGGMLLGKMPTLPLITQEEKYVTAGRSYNQFYDTKDILEAQYLEMKSDYEKDPSSVDIEKKMDLDTSWAVYNDISKVIADMRDISVEKSVPENIRDAAYDLLVRLNYGEDPTKLTREVLDLQSLVIHEKTKGMKPEELTSDDRSALKEAEINDKLYTWDGGEKNQATLTKLENEIARAIYGDDVTKSELSTVKKDFAYRRYFGYEDQWAERIYTAQSNAEKAQILEEARRELGAVKFKALYDKGRKTIILATGRSSYILISDDLRDLFFGK